MRIECFKYKNLTMKIRFSYFAFALLGLVACNNTPSEIAVDEEALANTQMAEAQREKGREGNPFGNANNNNLAMPTASAGGAQGVMLNPPHGEPGHRCDIAVGAPLPNDSQIINQVQPNATATDPSALPAVSNETQQLVQVQQPQSYVGANGEKLNPPHGQPGHRCDIPVGAPLNSAPAQQQAAPAQPAAQTIQQQVVIDPQQAQQHTGTTEPGWSGKPNPPHGQPGHRCDISVGEILP